MRLTAPLQFKMLRRHVFYNNSYQLGRLRKVKNLRVRESLQEKGINVIGTQDLFKDFPFLPAVPAWNYDHTQDDPVKSPLAADEEHPLFKERPVWSVTDRSKYPRNMEIVCAMNLLKTVQVKEGLPQSLLASIPESGEHFPGQHEAVQQTIREAYLCDSTQKRLPKRIRRPYQEGQFHPIISKLNKGKARLPYEVKFIYNPKEPRVYGIPIPRRNENLIRGLLNHCDIMGNDPAYVHIQDRRMMEACRVRQFFERRGSLIRLFLTVPFVVHAPKPLKPFASRQEVEATRNIALPELYPMEPWAHFEQEQIYRDAENFPITSTKHSAPHVVMGVGLLSKRDPRWLDRDYTSQSVTNCFMLAMGQAKLLYGEDVVGKELPSPVCVQFVYTDGQQFHFAAYQLNTLKLDDDAGVKNVFWEGEAEDGWTNEWGEVGEHRSKMFETCDYIKAIPTLEGYSPRAFNRFLAMYSQQ